MSQFDSFLSTTPFEVFDEVGRNLEGAALALIFLVLGLANTIVGLMETWLENKQMLCFLSFIINKAMFTCLLCWKNLGWKFWKNSKHMKKTQESPPRFFPQRNVVESSKHWKTRIMELKNRPRNSGTLGWKLTNIWWTTWRLFCYGLMQKCQNLERFGPQSFCDGNFSVLFWWEFRSFLWNNGRNSFLNTALTTFREPWWWAAQLF